MGKNVSFLSNKRGFSIVETVIAIALVEILVLFFSAALQYLSIDNMVRKRKSDIMAFEQSLIKLVGIAQFSMCNFGGGFPGTEVTFNPTAIAAGGYQVPTPDGQPAPQLRMYDSGCANPVLIAQRGATPPGMSPHLTVNDMRLMNVRMADSSRASLDLVISWTTTLGPAPRSTVIKDLLIETSVVGGGPIRRLQTGVEPSAVTIAKYSGSFNYLVNAGAAITANQNGFEGVGSSWRSATWSAAIPNGGFTPAMTATEVPGDGVVKVHISGNITWQKGASCTENSSQLEHYLKNFEVLVEMSRDGGGTFPIQWSTRGASFAGGGDFLLSSEAPVTAGDDLLFQVSFRYEQPNSLGVYDPDCITSTSYRAKGVLEATVK